MDHKLNQNSIIFDAEEVGNAIRDNMPKELFNGYIFEGYDLWFKMIVALLKEIIKKYNGDIYIPMTLVYKDSFAKISDISASDVQKILNLKHAWEFILDKDVIQAPTNYYLAQHIAKLVNQGFFADGGRIRAVPVTIGGTSYVPKVPYEHEVKEEIDNIISSGTDSIDIAISLVLYIMKTQIFNDGNKRTAIIFANHYLISKGKGLIIIPDNLVEEFRKLLVNYYEGTNTNLIKEFLLSKCYKSIKKG